MNREPLDRFIANWERAEPEIWLGVDRDEVFIDLWPVYRDLGLKGLALFLDVEIDYIIELLSGEGGDGR